MTDEFLRVRDDCRIRVDEIEWRFSTSSGPGGQHVNTSQTRVEARLDITSASTLTDAQRHRLEAKLGPVDSVAVSDTRSQARNREIALDRLGDRLAAALERPKPRRKTRPTRGSRRRRLDSKRHKSQTKQRRRKPKLE